MTDRAGDTRGLEEALRRVGMTFGELSRCAQGIALFGSRAADCSRDGSDWDVICIGSGTSRRIGEVDLVWIHPRFAESDAWLGSDLAGHIGRHGVWLEGECPWRETDARFDVAAQRKREGIERTLRSLSSAWGLLGRRYRERHIERVRRDVQRLALLQRSVAVPPTACLVAAAGESREILGEMLAGYGAMAGEFLEAEGPGY